MRRSALLPALATLFLVGHAAAQPVEPGWVHRSWTIEDGLPQNTVTAIAQTPDGYLWIGTAKGLVRFDGLRFVGFETASTKGLAGDRITVLTVDSRGDLWIGTERGGVSRYSAAGLDELSAAGLDATGRILDITEGPNNTIWVAGQTGLFRKSGDRFNEVSVEIDGRRRAATSLHYSRDGVLWIGTSFGLGRWLDGAFQLLESPELARRVRAMTDAEGGGLYVLVDGALGWLQNSKFTVLATGLGTGRALHRDRIGRLWVSAVGTGPGLVSEGTVSQTSLPAELRGAFVRDFFEDDTGSVWVAGGDDGLHVFQEPLFSAHRPEAGMPGGSVLRTISDRIGGIWTSTITAGVFRFSNGRFEHFSVDRGLAVPEVGFIAATSDGQPWIVARGVVSWFAGERFEPVRLVGMPPGLVGLGVVGLERRSLGGIWIASRDGIHYAESNNLSEPIPVPTTMVARVTEMREVDGDLWFSPNTGTACRLTGMRPECFTAAAGIPDVLIRDFAPGAGSAIWLGTYGGGLCELLNGSVSCLSDEHGLPDNTVHRILDDDDGYVWLSSNRGIARLRRVEIEKFFRGETATVRPDVYTELDGMPSRECNIGGIRAPDGTMWFPTMRGLASVDPRRAIGYRNRVPDPLIEEIQVDGRITQVGASDNFEAGSDRIEIRYTSIHFRNPQAVRFRVRLDGHDKTWVYAGSQRTATYTNLEPGSYKFWVQSSIGSSAWSEPVETEFGIEPFYYQTVWFRILVGLFLLGIALVAYRMRVGRLLERERLAKSEAEARRLAELDAAKSRFFANISHEFRTPLTLIISPLTEAIERGDLSDAERSRSQNVLENARRLLSLIDRLLDLSRLEAGKLELNPTNGELVSFARNLVRRFQPLAERREINLTFRSDLANRPTRFDRDRLQSILGNLVSNALKFTPQGGKVWLTLAEHDTSDVEFVVKDTGPGIPKGQLESIFERYQRASSDDDSGSLGTGIGLALTKELVDLHDGVMVVESEEGFGTAFIVRLPLIRVEIGPASLDSGPESPARGLPPSGPMGGGSKSDDESTSDPPLVLVVEDNDEVRLLIREQLSGRFQVIEARHGSEGLSKAIALKPDLVLTDVMMPGLDGFELCRRLKADPRLSAIPVVMLTAKVGNEHVVEAIDAGADDYIPKPYHAETLRRKLVHLINLRVALRDEFSRQLVVPSTGAIVNSAEEDFVARVLELVESRLGDTSFNVEQMASEIGLSRRQLTRRMKAAMDEAPSDLIHRMRMERAAQLLRSRAGTISEVAYRVGFRSASHFGAAFKEAYGHTPGEHVENGT